MELPLWVLLLEKMGQPRVVPDLSPVIIWNYIYFIYFIQEENPFYPHGLIDQISNGNMSSENKYKRFVK